MPSSPTESNQCLYYLKLHICSYEYCYYYVIVIMNMLWIWLQNLQVEDSAVKQNVLSANLAANDH